MQVYVSYDYGKSFKKISERFSFDGGNNSEVAIAQFYHSPADNKRVRGKWQQGLYPCCHREPGHPLGCPWGRGARHCLYGSEWWERCGWGSLILLLQSLPSQRLPWDVHLHPCQPDLCPDLLFSPVCPSTPSTSLWMPLPRTSGSPPTSATPSKASPFPSEQQTSSCTAGTPTSSWASTGPTLKNR